MCSSDLFKLAQSAGEVERLRAEGRRQIEEKDYAKPYDAENRAVTIGVVVVDVRRRQAIPPDGGSQPPSDR